MDNKNPIEFLKSEVTRLLDLIDVLYGEIGQLKEENKNLQITIGTLESEKRLLEFQIKS